MIDAKSKKSFNAAVWYIITNFISKSLLYICTPLYTRLLTTTEYGEYNNFLSWQNILVVLLTFDLSAAVEIAYYDYEDKRSFNGFINTITIFSYLIPMGFCTIIYFAGDFFVNIFSIRKKYLEILLIYIVFNSTLNIFQSEQRVQLKYKLSATLTIITSILTVATTLVFAFTFEDNLQGVLLGGVVINVIVGFILAIVIWKRCHDFKCEYMRYALGVAVPLIPHVLAGTILGSSDKVMITRYCGEEYTALYSLGYTISMVITMIASSINKAWTPWFFDRLRNNNRENIRTTSNIIVLVIATGSIFVCLLAPEILLIIGGKHYVSSAPIIPPVIISCLINCVSTFYINIEFYNKKTAGISIATMISAFLNVIMNYYFIRRFGYIAAAYTTLVSSAITLVFHLYKVKKQKMIDVFDNRFLLFLIGIFIVVSEIIIFIYKNIFVRYSILMVFVVIVFFALYKFRNPIQHLVYNLHEKEKTQI